MTNERSPLAKDIRPRRCLPADHPESLPKAEEGRLKLVWLGHSSVLLQAGSKNILIDPVLSEFASPVSFMGVRRFSDVPITAKEMPQIDVLLISHDHYDHMDKQTILKLDPKVRCYAVPLGLESYLKGWGIAPEKIHALSWWDTAQLEGLTITATPTQHFSGRNPLRSDASWWCGFCIFDGVHTAYYSGDGGYSEAFAKIGERFDIDLAILECGQYDAGWPHCHMFPDQTVQAFFDLKAKKFVPVHWGAFCLCRHGWSESVRAASSIADRRGAVYGTPRIGQLADYDHLETITDPWWEEYQ